MELSAPLTIVRAAGLNQRSGWSESLPSGGCGLTSSMHNASLVLPHRIYAERYIGASMKDEDVSLKKKVSLLNRYVQSICGLYSRVARQLNVDRSYVSRVARGERSSKQIEQALSTEFTRIVNENEDVTVG
ncbi:MAG: hypothetical protein ACLP3R_21990 [Candidatus Korobacteraceae bacterium]